MLLAIPGSVAMSKTPGNNPESVSTFLPAESTAAGTDGKLSISGSTTTGRLKSNAVRVEMRSAASCAASWTAKANNLST